MFKSLAGLVLGLALVGTSTAASKPNVIVVMADDQDLLLDSMSVMPNVESQIGAQGVTYTKHYCTVAWCCPSRVNFLTGRMAHNTNITALSPPYGGWTKFAENHLNDNYLPVWMQAAGIRTYYIGKLMNNYGVKNHNSPHPKGWDMSSMLVDPWTYNYHHSHWTNGKSSKISNYPGVHTHVTQLKALKAIDDAAKNKHQFFMMVAPVAPHVEIAGGVKVPPPPANFKGKFLNQKAPRHANWNPEKPSGASWVMGLPRLTGAEIQTCDKNQVGRLQNIAGVDFMVGKMIDKLKEHNLLDNTYIVYTSDNGFHIGNHRLLPGKRCPYEEDINIPLLIRGPGVPAGVTSTITNSHTDMAPTILQMLGVSLRKDFDGRPIAYARDTMASDAKKPSEHVSVEFWDSGGKPDGYKGKNIGKLYKDNSYKALRLISGGQSLYYSVWCDGEREFYDMNDDYAQMNNRLAKNFKGAKKQYFGRPEKQLYTRLNAVLLVTKGCKGDACRDPWGALFPKNQVNGLADAMKAEYDTFFQKQPRIKFKTCRKGFVYSNEAPHQANKYGAKN
jgi:arylsulfatase A-like enzyme